MPFTTLINAATLQQHLDDPDWCVIDVRHDLGDLTAGLRAYEQGHLPGARFLAVETDLSGAKKGNNGRHPLPEREAFCACLNKLGLKSDFQVVVYDAHGGQFAARLWWLLKWIGHDNVAVLDGGVNAWLAAGGKLVTSSSLPTADEISNPIKNPDTKPLAHQTFSNTPLPNSSPSNSSFEPRDSHYVAIPLTEVEAYVNAKNADSATAIQHLVDARAPERYRGEVEPLDPVAGHIPHADNFFFKQNLNPDETFKSAAVLREQWSSLFGAQASDALQGVVHYCGSGVTACHNILACAIAGYAPTVLYAGSWSEWCADEQRAVARGESQVF